jgi:hypothetical protein
MNLFTISLEVSMISGLGNWCGNDKQTISSELLTMIEIVNYNGYPSTHLELGGLSAQVDAICMSPTYTLDFFISIESSTDNRSRWYQFSTPHRHISVVFN